MYWCRLPLFVTNPVLCACLRQVVLEKALRNFSCLSKGDTIMIAYGDSNFYLDIVEVSSSPNRAYSADKYPEEGISFLFSFFLLSFLFFLGSYLPILCFFLRSSHMCCQ